MRHLGILSLIVCLASASGCNLCCWGKRNAELTGPTDIRKSQMWCLGEDAVFARPMGPSRENYGLKQTSWRAWPTEGTQCADGSCGPVLAPATPNHRPSPSPILEQSPPSGLQDGSNPFRDDAHPLPAPMGSGSQVNPSPAQRILTATRPANFQSLFSPTPTATLPIRQSPPAKRTEQQKAVAPPRYVAVPAAPSKSPFSGQAVPANNRAGLNISVSEAIDTPARSLAPIASSGIVVRAVAANKLSPESQQETLASLERLMETPAGNQSAESNGPAVIRNEYAAAAEPFRLATRDSLPTAKRDPAAEKATLSALKQMMSDDAQADAAD